MKIVTIVGARPQFIKAAVISRCIERFNYSEHGDMIKEVLIHTGQHYDTNMSDIFFNEMYIPKPNYNLDIGGGNHGAMTGQMLEKVEQILLNEKPNVVLVYGDTNSTLAGALAAVKLHIPVAHVEAGLRSFNMRMPEEVNRILTDQISQWLFCPTQTAVMNLEQEGFTKKNNSIIEQVGDVMYDAMSFYKTIAKPSNEVQKLLADFKNKFYLATVHRAENTDDIQRLSDILRALDAISEKCPVVWPIHPRTKKLIQQQGIIFKNIICLEPVGYFDMISLLGACRGVFTDSGGLQKEAYFSGKHCVTLRNETEWVEVVEHGFNTLVGADFEKIVKAEIDIRGKGMVDTTTELYGNGHAGEKIVNTLLKYYN